MLAAPKATCLYEVAVSRKNGRGGFRIILCRLKWNVCAESLRGDDSHGVEALLMGVSMGQEYYHSAGSQRNTRDSVSEDFDCLFHRL